MSDCLFCKIANHEIPADIVYEDENFVAFRDINPQAPIHFLIIPKKHIETINNLEEEDAPLIGEMVILARKLAKEQGIDEKGYRLIYNCNREGGQMVYHIHLHLLGGRPMGWPPG